jgi:hypothetical protein
MISLDVSKNKLLSTVRCERNRLASLDISESNKWIHELHCEENPGDGESLFPVMAWFDNDSVSEELVDYSTDWLCDGKKITIDFRKAN